FKPFVYLAALEAGRTPDSVRNDAPIRIGKWTPENFKGKYYGKVTLTTALKKSLNSVSAQLAQEVGPKTVAEVAHRMGIESDLTVNASIALGTSEVTPLELTAAYVPFVNGGYRPDIHFIRRVTTMKGKVVYEHQQTAPRVIREDIAAMMNTMLSGVVEDGTAKKADFGWPAAGKTGTTQNSRDAWFIGYTSNLVTGVWFGNDDGAFMKGVTGGMLPAEAWRTFMAAAHEGLPVAPLRGMWKPGMTPPAPLPGNAPAATPPLPSSMPRPAESVSVAPVPRPVARVGNAPAENTVKRAIRQSAGQDTTASIRPVPKVGVGERQKSGSIMDVLLGR
ncbi:MAG: penicillin-binding protein, partial [Notoacmeibacter sp.]|nr:penicillin-binding protein [Notoacmeibacter sp.]